MDALKDEDVKEVPALPQSHGVNVLLHCIHVFDLCVGRSEEAERERQEQWAAIAGN